MMECHILPAVDMPPDDRVVIAGRLTREDSDFRRALVAGTQEGTIAICKEAGEIIGWARTERWNAWSTLEAFVGTAHRGRGVATFCAAGLVASCSCFRGSYGYAAVFRPSMKHLARKVGIAPVLFSRLPDGRWELA